jgi:hypothetical protein
VDQYIDPIKKREKEIRDMSWTAMEESITGQEKWG